MKDKVAIKNPLTGLANNRFSLLQTLTITHILTLQTIPNKDKNIIENQPLITVRLLLYYMCIREGEHEIMAVS